MPIVSGSVAAASGSTALLYNYEVTGVDKLSIDTFVDGTTVPNFAGYTVLEVWMYLRTDEAGLLRSTVDMTLNNDTGANYDRVYLDATNVTASAGGAHAQNSIQFIASGNAGTANVFGVFRMSMPNYLGTTGFKVGELVGGVSEVAQANCQFNVETILYRSTSAVTRLKIAPDTGGTKFKVGSRLMVYGR